MSLFDESQKYEYTGLELTPKVMAEILIEIFDGKRFTRSEAIDECKKFHTEHGGILQKTDYTAAFKKAASDLKNDGIKNVVQGVWELCYKAEVVDAAPKAKKEQKINFSIDREIGDGERSIYVYYYDAYKELALLQGRNIWECKIGRTDADPLDRVMGQAGTCYPELPRVALIIKCDDSRKMERAIHSFLDVQGKKVEGSPGREWFITSPEEIEALYLSIINGANQTTG